MSQKNSTQTEKDPNRVRPWGYALTADGDLNFQSETNRYEEIEGEAAVIQDLKVALSTTRGEDPTDPEFGLDIFAATRSTQQLRAEIVRTLEHDDYRHDRVAAVTDVRIRQLAGSRRAALRVFVELASGATETIDTTVPLGGAQPEG